MSGKVDPTEIAERCLASTNGDFDAAVALMVQATMKHKRLYNALMKPLVNEACGNLICGIAVKNLKPKLTAVKPYTMPQPSAEQRSFKGALRRAKRANFQNL